MKFNNIFILLFLLSAFAIGIMVEDRELVDSSLNNASLTLQNLTLDHNIESNIIPNLSGFYKILEQFIQFMTTLFIEVLRAGVHFGQDNPNYFEAENIFYIIKLIIILTIISLLIKPLFYIGILVVLLGMFIINKFKNKKDTKEDKVK